MASTNPARGMRDFLPADVRKREYVIGIIKQVYESYGFEPLETPAVENIETLMGKYGDEGNQLIFKVLKRGEKLDESLETGDGRRELADLALRYDLTVPLARVVANKRNDLPKFFKRYQIQPVWRADRPARGRFREFYQCDVDCIGSSSMVVEAELISAVCEVLRKLEFHDFVIRVNHRDILRGILEAVAVPTEKHLGALVALDKLDKIGRDGVTKEFLQRGVSKDSADKLLTFFESVVESNIKDVIGKPSLKKLTGLKKRIVEEEKLLEDQTKKAEKTSQELIAISRELEDETKKLEKSNLDIGSLTEIPDRLIHYSMDITSIVQMDNNLRRIKSLREFLSNHGVEENKGISEISTLTENIPVATSGRILVDPSLARGLSYYTGTIIEVNVPDLSGSLGGGGRYDGLIGMFGKEQIPACGFSLGLERILVVMDERNMFPPEIADSTPADVMVTIWSEETIAESLKLANELRSSSLRVTLYPEADKLGKQLKYADSIKVPWVCVLGETELAEGKITLKNMKTGEQSSLDRGQIAAVIKR